MTEVIAGVDTIQTEAMEKELLVNSLRERLERFAARETLEEVEQKEVELLVGLILLYDEEALSWIPETEEAYQLFKKYLMEKGEDGMKLAALLGKEPRAVGVDLPKVGKRKTVHRYHWYAASAALVVALVACGGVGAVSAEKNGGGIFHWLIRNDEKMAVVISPEDKSEKEIEGPEVYYSVEEVPEEYREHLTDVQQLKSLEGYNFTEIEINKLELYDSITSTLEQVNGADGKKEITIYVLLHGDVTVLRDDRFIQYEHISDTVLSGKEMEIYSKLDDEGLTDYLISFFMNSGQYCVGGKQPVDILEQVAEEYYLNLSK